MPLKNTPHQYGLIAQGLHHLSALVVLALLALGFYMTALDYYHPYYQTAPAWHKTLGVGFAVLTLFRWVWRLYNPPPLPTAPALWQQHLALWVQRLFYGLIAGLVISGYLLSTGEGKPIVVVEALEIPAVFVSKDLAKTAGDVHETLVWVLMFFLCVHVAAAIKHYFFEKPLH